MKCKIEHSLWIDACHTCSPSLNFRTKVWKPFAFFTSDRTYNVALHFWFLFILSSCIFSLFLMHWPVYFIWLYSWLGISVYIFFNCYQQTKAFVRFASTHVILYIEIVQTVRDSEPKIWVCNDNEEESETWRPLLLTNHHQLILLTSLGIINHLISRFQNIYHL